MIVRKVNARLVLNVSPEFLTTTAKFQPSRHNALKKTERATGFEPATTSLGS